MSERWTPYERLRWEFAQRGLYVEPGLPIEDGDVEPLLVWLDSWLEGDPDKMPLSDRITLFPERWCDRCLRGGDPIMFSFATAENRLRKRARKLVRKLPRARSWPCPSCHEAQRSRWGLIGSAGDPGHWYKLEKHRRIRPQEYRLRGWQSIMGNLSRDPH